MERRKFIIFLSGAAAAWPLLARAQQTGKLPTIGYVAALSEAGDRPRRAAFARRLMELGWVEGRNIRIEYRWAGGAVERATEIAPEFVRLNVDVIVTSGTAVVAAAKQATSVIPIVFAGAGDPVGTGLVASLARPGGNVTGLSLQQTDTAGKRVELLREVVPGLHRLAILVNIGSAVAALDMRETEATARALGLRDCHTRNPAGRGSRARRRGPQGPRGSTLCRCRPARGRQRDSYQHFSARRSAADDVRFSGACRSGRYDVLWAKRFGLIPTRR